MPKGWTIHVANPSSYPRSDFVEVSLEGLEVPVSLGAGSLRLWRVFGEDQRREIPYQIDPVFGPEAGHRA